MTEESLDDMIDDYAKDIGELRRDEIANVAKLRNAIGGGKPSAGHTLVDEVIGLLRVARVQRDAAWKENAELNGDMANLKGDLRRANEKWQACYEDLKKAEAELAELKKPKPAAEAGGWVKCSERMPDYCEQVLITTGLGTRFLARLMERSAGDTFEIDMCEREFPAADFIAWRPLPAPPAEGA